MLHAIRTELAVVTKLRSFAAPLRVRGATPLEAASPVTSSPADAKGKLDVVTADGQVICFG